MMNWTRIAIITTTTVGIGGLLFWSMRPQPLEVEVEAVSDGPMETTIEEEGKTRLRDRFVVSAPQGGMLRRHEWKVGDSITAGKAVAYLTPVRSEMLDARRLAENEARLASAGSALEAAMAKLQMAKEQLKAATADAEYWQGQLAREEKLMKAGDIATSRMDKTRSEFQRADAARMAAAQSVNSAQAEIDRARADVTAAKVLTQNPAPREQSTAATVPVFSPVSGRVIRVVRQSEGTVVPGDPILELGDTRALEVETELLSSDAVRVGPGTLVRLTRWGGDTVLEARVRHVEPTGFTKISALGVEEQRVRVISDLVSPAQQWTRLGEGYRVEASFVLWSGEKALQIPSSALFREGGKWLAYVVSGAVAEKREVGVGHRNGLRGEVLSGLKAGEQVIAHPDEKVKPGVAVSVRAKSNS